MRTLALALSFLFLLTAQAHAASKPNFVFILCDDLGFGDVKANNSEGKIATPHMDRIAARGVRFTDAHSPSSVCSPTRYGVMTGRYSWRSKLQSGVLGGLSPRMIEQDRLTVASFLKQQGYRTACVGKWHMGMDWVIKPGRDVSELKIETAEQVNSVDYTQPITNGPTSVGFDSYFGISASLDMVPYCFIENDRVPVNPTETMKLAMNATAKNKQTFTREGPGSPGFKGEDVLPAFTKRAIQVIGDAAKAKEPLFLYLPLNSPHTPILPSDAWKGRSKISLYADFVMETDDAIGQIVTALEAQGIADDTMVVVTSDNGCSPSADFPGLAAVGHNPSHIYRGHKADIFDGGHRVPFLVQWPARVKPSVSDQTVCLIDFMATAAEVIGAKLPDTAAEDSVSFLPALEGRADKPLREAIVHHSVNGSFAIRQGNWKLELCPDSGGWSEPKPGQKGKATKELPPVQLYDLSTDIGERRNVQADHPEVVERLTELLKKYVADGRSTPGAPQQNTVHVELWKHLKR
jgi:arylsulfatase A